MVRDGPSALLTMRPGKFRACRDEFMQGKLRRSRGADAPEVCSPVPRGGHPRRKGEGDGAPKGAQPFLCTRALAGGAWRLSARRRGVHAAPGRASGWPFRLALGSGDGPFWAAAARAAGKPCGSPSASSWRGVVVPPGGAPAPPGRMS